MSTHALTLVPAIDLREGRCVRLRQGDPAQETRYDDDPVARARAFAAAGAERLHVVDLDGAFGAASTNMQALKAICAAVDVPVQTGGGIRKLAHVDDRLAAGASFVIVGTLLIEDPKGARRLIERRGEKIIAGIDARGKSVAVRGWQSESFVERDALVRKVYAWGVQRIVFTEISRDGEGTGYDLAALREVAALAPMRVTASGGAHAIADLQALREQTPPNVDHAIIGRALYEGTIDLAAALGALRS